MKMNKELQHKILDFLKEHPAPQPSRVWKEFEKSIDNDEELVANMLYLEEHGLIVSGITRGLNDYMVNSGIMRLTKDGWDYLSPDGGLGAERNIVTVKIHDESLARFAEFIYQNAPNQSVADNMLARLRSLPAAAIERCALKLLDLAMDKLPGEALRLIQTAIGHL